MEELKQPGRYGIVRMPGSGAMSIVCEGIDTSLNHSSSTALADSEQAAYVSAAWKNGAAYG